MKKRSFLIGTGLVLLVIAISIIAMIKGPDEKKAMGHAEATSNQAVKPVDWGTVEQVFGRKGTVDNDVLKVSFPREDLKVSVGEVPIEPGFALTSWVAFKPVKDGVMVMGDLVLLQSELPAVLSELTKVHIDVTAIHNHLTTESPAITYVHYEGQGEAVKLVQQMKAVLSVTKTPFELQQTQVQSETPGWSKVEAILGYKGKAKGKVIGFTVPRQEKITEMDGTVIPPFMGTATAINFQAVGQKAAITGDFVLLANEVPSVQRALTKNGITVTAIHSHMLHESPKLYFMHFWSLGNSEDLAKGLKAALEQTNVEKPK
ncbi:DUF1259 domain-containing protein [Paenibacillus filicis]|uniref:DUF1259 domain-containing protein n=1 Tax=Paenibacillus gyeongsangnamensis TaxID=3388067 RepID=A0ABT4QDY6_9BACL|nr:DUF1259 domain-containing protein [Paenibacillus filicis]MCZ8515060.1 DUF1259 domain-containing protein [Paenibacillus filicis]